MKSQIKSMLAAFSVGFFLLLNCPLFAQFEFNGQLVQRGEYRNGFGKLMEDTLSPAAFISQRLRLQATYKMERLQFYASIQDIRTWGNTSQTKLTDGFLSLHEGWAEIGLDSFWSAKIGRQELNYDNVRFLGNLDWALQARAHDIALLKFEKRQHKFHAGFAYNQNAENLNGNTFTVANQYKTAQMLWYNYKKPKFELSALFWNNGKQAVRYDSLGNIVEQHLRFMQTVGLPALKFNAWKSGWISAFAYAQFGKDVADNTVSAYDVSLQASHSLLLDSKRSRTLKFTLGGELLSGTPNDNSARENQSFSPLYGTNHIHNGYMDYFFVGGRFENTVGLNDLFLKARFDSGKKWFLALDAHQFSTNAKAYKNGKALDAGLGTELDFTAGVVLREAVSLQAGYSQMFASSTLKSLQKTIDPASAQNWMYVMLIVRPKSDKKFIGVLN